MHTRIPETLMLLLAVGAGGCRTKLADNLGGFDCDPKSGVCLPRVDGSTDGSDGGSPSTDGGDVGSPSADSGDVGDGGSPNTDGGDGSDGGDGGDGPDGGQIVPLVQIASPASPAYTNGSISIQVVFSPPSAAPAQVDLLDGSSKLVTISAPFTYVWNTALVAEGPHQITARAAFGAQTVTSAPVTIFVDRTRPQIRSQLPAPAATDVDLSNPIQIGFSEPLIPATVTGSVSLSAAGVAIPITTALSADGKTVTISLSNRSAITLPADVTVAVSATVSDLAGNQLGTVAPWLWHAPLWINYGMLLGQYPSLALDPSDAAIVCTAVEQGAIGSNEFLLQIARHGGGQTWDTSFGSPQGPQGTSFVPAGGSIAVGTDGQPIVAWPEFQGANTGNPTTVHIAKWSGTVWDKKYGQVDALQEIGSNARNPWLAIGASDQMFLTWAETSQALVVSVYAARWAGTSWDLSYGGIGVIGADGPVLHFDSGGQPVLGWRAGSDNGVSRWTGSGWMTTPTYTNSTTATLALDATDQPIVTSISGQISDPYIHVLHLVAGAWQELVPAIGAGSQPANAQVLLDKGGHPVVAWADSDGSARNVRVARHTGTAWDLSYGVLSAVAGANTDATNPRILLDRFDTPVVAWQETDGTRFSTYVWKSNH